MKLLKQSDNYLSTIINDINSIHDLDQLLQRLLTEARAFTNSDAGSIYVRAGDRNLAIKYSQNATKEKTLQPGEKLIFSLFKIPIDDKTISGFSALKGKILNIPDMYNISKNKPYSHSRKYDELSGYKSISSLTIPLSTMAGEVFGVLQLINKKKLSGKIIKFTKRDERIARSFSAIAAMTLERAEMTHSLLNRMVQMTALRDPKETSAHANRVSSMAVEIYSYWAELHSIPSDQREKERDLLRLGSILHDVGKVGISDVILKKKGRLTDSERDIMKRHSFIGYQLFQNSYTKYELVAKEIALRHHENWDGSGYPGQIDLETGYFLYGKEVGLVGEDIPFFARIVSICDVYDALSHSRVYKDAWRQEDVIAEIKKMSGIKFDPQLVNIFFKVYTNIRKICKLYPD
ncbi:MAG: HD domain-containing protein [Spirochaetales bacterium]|nr:HD domain-containing protein [Spirochaetales bacterium]